MLHKDNDTLCLEVILLNAAKRSIKVLALGNKSALHFDSVTNTQFIGFEFHTNILQ